MSEPIAVEENLDEGSMPEPRNFICGVVEGELVESPNAAALPSEDKIDDEPSTVSLLHLSNNPWRRGCGEKWNKAADWTEQVPPYDAIEALHLLNKLTESNFEMVASKFCHIQNEHSNHMERIADMFFTKAISEPLYTKLYCRLLKKLFDSKETNKNALNLVLLIITQCNLLLFSSANKEFDLEENKFDKLKLEGTFSLYYELFNLNLVTLSSFLMVLFGFLQSSRFDNLPFVVQVIQKCGGKVERDVHGENKGETLVWTKILDLIGNKCNLQKDDLSRRTSLMLSNILLLKERSWESALTDSVTNDDPVCEIQELAPQKRPSKKERRKERKEKRRLEKATTLGDTRKMKLKKKKSKVEEEEIELNSCNEPWKRKVIRMKDLSDHELVMMNAKLLLNKLDVDNYSSISKQFFGLDFNKDNVGPIIEYLLKKASNEGLYAEKYAELIRDMRDLVRPDSNQNETVFANNTPLKSRVLENITSGVKSVLEQVNNYLIPHMKQGRVVESQNLDPPDLEMNMDLKIQLINTLLFIAALFKQDLVDMKQVLSTICMNLIQEVSEKYLESLVVFLSKVGEKIDENKRSYSVFVSEWNKVMTAIDTAIADRSNISKKTYFMLLNFVDLSRRAWVPRVVHISEPQFSASGLVEREKHRFKDVRNKQDVSLYYAKELNFLNVSKAPWQRGCFKRKQNEEACLVKKVKTILNQINAANFDSCSSKFNRRCKIKRENVDLYVRLVFEECMRNSKYIDIFLKLILSHVAYKAEIKGSERNPIFDEFAFVDLFVEKSIHTFNEHKTLGTEHDVLLNNCTVISRLFTSNLVDLNVLLDLLINFLDHPTEYTLLCLTKIVLLCGRKIEKQVYAKENTQIKWMEIVKGIEILSVSGREEISNRTYLMLTNVMIMKNKNWVSKTDLGTVMVTECRWKRDLDEITTETKWKSKTKQFQPRHVRIQEPLRNEVRIQEPLRNEKKEEIAHKAKENERKEEFMVQDILKDLDMADNPWRRGEFKQELTEKDRIIMEAKTLLNKLAENNFQSIVDQFCKINFLPGTIEPIVNTLFVKGILETKFTELHAKFVKSVSDSMDNMATGGTKVDDVGETETERVRTKHVKEVDEAVQFDLKTRMLNKCAMEIHRLHSESSVISDEIYHQKRLNLHMARPDFDELIKNREKDDVFLMHHREALKKIISVGTCQFLGELYNADVVDTDFILTTIVCDLLAYDSEEILECAVKLISVVGKKLERVIKKSLNVDYRDGWDIVLEDIATKASRRDRWSNRVYFMLLDLMDLKERDWLPRVIIIPTRQFKAPKKSRGY
uniref:Eukaryotic translation initiation factor 4 gamma 1 n=1 Tax=Cacopsylla melanoneura TaxID=428564 RepID=A0A8D9AW35_9HEMI